MLDTDAGMPSNLHNCCPARPVLRSPLIKTLTDPQLEQIQSIVNDPKPEAQVRRVARKVNPLKNRAVMLSLNPHHEARIAAQAAYQEANKAGRKAVLKERRARKSAGRAFHAKANLEGDIKF